ncbi:MAG: T9SS type A sorting domain-containing protein [Bacteroidales bacterium]|nr:T9SS type A sorting domain-containing protein [Bacteroidales bacterium]
MRRFFVFLSLFLSPLAFLAQDTLTVMQYNLLEYGNYNSGFADCYETNNSTQRKDECIRTLLDYVKPDILTVCEFGATQTLLNRFLNNNLNINGVDYWRSDNIINYAGSNIINHIFYDSRKMMLKKHVALRTSPRDTDIYELYLKTQNLVFGDTIKLICVVAHPKAGMNYEANRRALMQTAMDYINLHYHDDNVLIMGDFNMYRASETGYQLLTRTYSHPEVCFVDPLASVGGVGEWNGNSQFAPFHTQSTRRYATECFSSGGLDDRFDFILMSDEVYMGFNRLKYVTDSYFAVGNDAHHFNQTINQGGNTMVPDVVAEALFDGSDHLPVTMKMKAFATLGVDENQMAEGLRVYPNPTDDVLHLETMNTSSQPMEYRVTNMLGQVLMSGQTTNEINISALPDGLYFVNVNGLISKFVKTSALH